MTLNCSSTNSLSMLLLYEILRLMKVKFLSHIMISSRSDYSIVTLIPWIVFSIGSLLSSSLLTVSGGGNVIVSLKSSSMKRHNGLSAYKNNDSTFVIRHFLS